MRQEKKGGKIIKKIWKNINKYQDDWYKFNQINNQSKYKWLNNSLERQRFFTWDRKPGPNYIWLLGNTN